MQCDRRAAFLAIHLSVQMMFTVNAHSAALREAGDTERLGRPALALAIAVGFAAGLAGSIDWSYRGLSVGEIAYRLFMAYYGLLAPAYLLTTRARRPIAACATTILLALPLMWIAFIERHMPWAIAAAAVMFAGAALSWLTQRNADSLAR